MGGGSPAVADDTNIVDFLGHEGVSFVLGLKLKMMPLLQCINNVLPMQRLKNSSTQSKGMTNFHGP